MFLLLKGTQVLLLLEGAPMLLLLEAVCVVTLLPNKRTRIGGVTYPREVSFSLAETCSLSLSECNMKFKKRIKLLQRVVAHL
jgi:hypothetical protein